MVYFYAVYLTFCVLGQGCKFDHFRMDDFNTVAFAQSTIQAIGENPHWEVIENDPVFMFSYGECYRGRKDNTSDINLMIYMIGGDCADCINYCYIGDSE